MQDINDYIAYIDKLQKENFASLLKPSKIQEFPKKTRSAGHEKPQALSAKYASAHKTQERTTVVQPSSVNNSVDRSSAFNQEMHAPLKRKKNIFSSKLQATAFFIIVFIFFVLFYVETEL